ncbi:hypothetical protein [uncultured Alsobacter sp.]|uniref:hypothetical protein n=1 Tax=uncultured Alsobacter sp. TaxID=1748258 RepID=UPI0025E721F2|nr:hypothetical protein [uncultured Alsobacter sp.]
MSIVLDSVQLDLARHALGLPNRRRRSYRNHYVTGHRDETKAWRDMIAVGAAKEGRAGPLSGGDPWFSLTTEGAIAALRKNEGLDDETFPNWRSMRAAAKSTPTTPQEQTHEAHEA